MVCSKKCLFKNCLLKNVNVQKFVDPEDTIPFYYWAKKNEKEEVSKVQVDDKPQTNYSFKRTPIDFTMADLEAEEEEDEFKANIEPVERKTLPKRKCSEKALNDV